MSVYTTDYAAVPGTTVSLSRSIQLVLKCLHAFVVAFQEVREGPRGKGPGIIVSTHATQRRHMRIINHAPCP